MSETEPRSIDNLRDLLPERCRPCVGAQLLLLVTAVEKPQRRTPTEMSNDIDQFCPGYCGKEAAGFQVGALETDDGSFFGLFADSEALDSCPYYALSDDL